MLEVQKSDYRKEKEKEKINFGWKLALQMKPEGTVSNGTQNSQLNEHYVVFLKNLHKCGI